MYCLIMNHIEHYQFLEGGITIHQYNHDGALAALTLGTARETEHGSEWCITVYAEDADSFKSTVSFNLDLARKRNCNAILCIHAKQFDDTHKQMKWLETTDFGFDLLLYERKMI